MTEFVVPLDVMVRWDAIAPVPALVGPDEGVAALALAAHEDDPDQRSVVLVWRGTRWLDSSDPRTPLSRHRLHDRGLRDVAWLGVVRQSPQVAELGMPDGRVTHHVVLLDDRVIEVVAELLTVHRVAGDTASAAVAGQHLDPEDD